MDTPTMPADGENKNKTMALIAYILFFIPLLTDAKNDPFVKYHVKQGLALFIAGVAINIINGFLPGLLALIVTPILDITFLILWIQGMLHAWSGKQEPLAIIGKFGEQFNF